MSKRSKADNVDARDPVGPFTAADLPLDEGGCIYHLQVRPEQIATDILLVGDPGRAEFIGRNFLKDVEFEHQHRGLVTVTGVAEISGEPATIISPLRATAATSGIGTPSLEIVVNELVLLNEIDFETRRRKSDYPELHVIRVGSSGGLQQATRLGTPIITSYAIGLDNTGLYYDAPPPDKNCARLETELAEHLGKSMRSGARFYGKIHPYVSRADATLVTAMRKAAEVLGVATRTGLTASAPGFFAPQGRDTARVKPSIPDLDGILSEFDPGIEDQRIENMEMEASFLLHFLGGLGYRAGAICAAIANRQQDTFTDRYQEAIEDATRVALLALAMLRGHG